MTKNLLITIHGNPGRPEDFRNLLGRLDLGKAVEMASYALPATIEGRESLFRPLDHLYERRGQRRVVAIAYSWGAYLLASWAQARGVVLDGLVFLNPTLMTDTPISKAKRLLIGMPGLGQALLARASGKLADDFIENCFAPGQADLAVRRDLRDFLNDAGVWKRALSCKFIQQSEPLSEGLARIARQVVIFRGEDDKAVNWNTQLAVIEAGGLTKAPHEIYALAGEGHALPWTCPEAVVEAIGKIINQ